MKYIKKTILFCLPLFLIFILSYAKEINMTSDSIDYDEAKDFAIAKGNVTIEGNKSVLKSDEATFEIKKKMVHANGHVSIKDQKSYMTGDSADYNYAKGTGKMKNVVGDAGPWHFSAREADKVGENRYNLTRVKMTSCDYDSSDFTVKATSAKITAGKRITTFNPLFFYKGVPVFYLPVFVHASGSHKDSLEVRPGYDNIDGLMANVIWGYPLSENGYGKLYIDWYGKRGLGTGAEYIYKNPTTNLDLYGYHITEQYTGIERYNETVSYTQRLSPVWTTQARADFLSDTSFINNYFQDTQSGSNQTLHSFLSFNRQTAKTNVRFVTERYDTYQISSGTFEPDQIVLPRIEYTLFPSRGKTFYTSLTGNIQNQYLKTNDYYLQTGALDGNLSKNYRISKNATFTPQLGIVENWQSRTSASDLTETFITHYYSNLNLRYRPKSWINWDFAYNYKIRTLPNQLVQDLGAVDYGEETNQVTFANSMYVGKSTIRNTIGYNIHMNKGEVIDNWTQKLTPLINEYTWSPPKGYYLYVREEQNLEPWQVHTAQAYINWGRLEQKYVNFGVFYQYANPDNLDFAAGFGFWASRKFRIDYSLKTTALGYFNSWRVNDEELSIFRNIHCWEIKLGYRRRLLNDEVFFSIGINASATPGGTSKNREIHPW